MPGRSKSGAECDACSSAWPTAALRGVDSRALPSSLWASKGRPEPALQETTGIRAPGGARLAGRGPSRPRSQGKNQQADTIRAPAIAGWRLESDPAAWIGRWGAARAGPLLASQRQELVGAGRRGGLSTGCPRHRRGGPPVALRQAAASSPLAAVRVRARHQAGWQSVPRSGPPPRRAVRSKPVPRDLVNRMGPSTGLLFDSATALPRTCSTRVVTAGGRQRARASDRCRPGEAIRAERAAGCRAWPWIRLGQGLTCRLEGALLACWVGDRPSTDSPRDYRL